MPSKAEPLTAKLGLGTVQFGIEYGISNTDGRTPPDEVGRILDLARARGIRVLDTAPAYGQSEAVLGGFPLEAQGFRVVTKTPKFEAGSREGELAASLEASLARLGLTRAYGLLFHRAGDTAGRAGAAWMAEARRCKESGRVGKIGISVYTADEIDAVMDGRPPDLIQVPLSLFDQRLLRSGHLKALKAAGVEVHVRSVFLQGLLLMDPQRLPSHLRKARAPLEAMRAYAAAHSLSPLGMALGFALGLPEVDVVLCGVNSARHLEDICAAAVPLPSAGMGDFALEDATLLNPALWGSAK